MTILRRSFSLCLLLLASVEGAKFSISGPTLTVTLKDPQPSSALTTASSKSKSLFQDPTQGTQWLDLSSIRPNAVWGIQSESLPLPNWFPSLKAIKATIGYQYTDLKRLPSWIEASAKFSRPAADLLVQPTYEVKSGQTSVIVQASRGANYVLARLASQQRNLLQALRGSVLFSLPYASIIAVRLAPSVDLSRNDVSCLVEAVTGGTARTKAVLNLEYQNPTLQVIHMLDDRNTVAPEITLYNAKITYQWNLQLSQGGSLRVKVDPVQDVQVTWTDQSASGGSWVTDLRLPLEGTSVHALAADVRVRRQFNF